MNFNNEIDVFINDFVKDLNEGTASIFAGAGLSVPAGFVNWTDLMEEIARDLGLDINNEKDLLFQLSVIKLVFFQSSIIKL